MNGMDVVRGLLGGEMIVGIGVDKCGDERARDLDWNWEIWGFVGKTSHTVTTAYGKRTARTTLGGEG